MSFIPQINVFNSVTNTQTCLEMKNFVKCLGMLIDSDLSWKYHTDYICHKVGKSIGIVDILRHYIPQRLLFNIYHTLIAP